MVFVLKSLLSLLRLKFFYIRIVTKLNFQSIQLILPGSKAGRITPEAAAATGLGFPHGAMGKTANRSSKNTYGS